jgi:hypothetical protein
MPDGLPTMQGQRRPLWLDAASPFFFAALVAVIAARGIGSGLATHGDSRTIYEQTVPAILHGSYFPSRSYGNPLYEYAVAVLFSTGGLVLASLYSLVSALTCLFMFDRLLGNSIPGLSRFCVMCAFSLNPLFLINAFAITEWMQATVLLLCLLLFARCWLSESSKYDLLGIGVSSALLVLTRPDEAIVCICLYFALIWHIGFKSSRSLPLAVTLVVSGALTLAIFGLLNHGFAFLTLKILATTSYLRRLIVATVGVFSVFGFIAPAIIAAVAVGAVRKIWVNCKSMQLQFWTRLFLLTAPIGLARFALLPDKLEYIMYIAVIALLMLAHERLPWSWLALVALSMTVPSIATLSLFYRLDGTDQLIVRPRLGPGALAQDLGAMRYNWRLMNDPALLSSIAAIVYGTHATPLPTLHAENWAAGLVSDSGDLVIGQSEAYHLDNPRSEPKYQRRRYSTIYICNRSVFVNGSFGWRISEPPIQWPAVNKGINHLNLACHKETP